MQTNSLLIARGATYFGSGTPATTGDSVKVEGTTVTVTDTVNGTGREVTLKLVRNTTGAALRAKAQVKYAAGYEGRRVDGQTTTTAARVDGIVDDAYTSTIQSNDLFWMVVKGPVKVLTPLEGNGNNVFTVGDYLVALTAATSGATTAGRPITQVLTGATATLAAQIQGVFGYAMSAMTTAQTNADLLIMADIRFS